MCISKKFNASMYDNHFIYGASVNNHSMRCALKINRLDYICHETILLKTCVGVYHVLLTDKGSVTNFFNMFTVYMFVKRIYVYALIRSIVCMVGVSSVETYTSVVYNVSDVNVDTSTGRIVTQAHGARTVSDMVGLSATHAAKTHKSAFGTVSVKATDVGAVSERVFDTSSGASGRRVGNDTVVSEVSTLTDKDSGTAYVRSNASVYALSNGSVIPVPESTESVKRTVHTVDTDRMTFSSLTTLGIYVQGEHDVPGRERVPGDSGNQKVSSDKVRCGSACKGSLGVSLSADEPGFNSVEWILSVIILCLIIVLLACVYVMMYMKDRRSKIVRFDSELTLWDACVKE